MGGCQKIIKENSSVFQNGDGYSKNCGASTMNFEKLAVYAKSRKGQTIVCEKEGANWLPFEKFRKNKTSINKNYKEVIWTNLII